VKNTIKIMSVCLAAPLLLGAAAKHAVAHKPPVKHVQPKPLPPAPPPDGWGAYKFGMTPQQVRDMPGLKWQRLQKSAVLHFVVYRMDSDDVTALDGRDFKPSVFFDEKQKLDGILLTSVEKKTAQQCEASLQQLVQMHQKQFGDFSPKVPPGSKQGLQSVWHAVAGTHSQYAAVTMTTANGSQERYEARHEFHDAPDTVVDLTAEPDQNSCTLKVQFAQG
jgi:hypothetical protein